MTLATLISKGQAKNKPASAVKGIIKTTKTVTLEEMDEAIRARAGQS
jgi:hypothetical protein